MIESIVLDKFNGQDAVAVIQFRLDPGVITDGLAHQEEVLKKLKAKHGSDEGKHYPAFIKYCPQSYMKKKNGEGKLDCNVMIMKKFTKEDLIETKIQSSRYHEDQLFSKILKGIVS